MLPRFSPSDELKMLVEERSPRRFDPVIFFFFFFFFFVFVFVFFFFAFFLSFVFVIFFFLLIISITFTEEEAKKEELMRAAPS